MIRRCSAAPLPGLVPLRVDRVEGLPRSFGFGLVVGDRGAHRGDPPRQLQRDAIGADGDRGGDTVMGGCGQNVWSQRTGVSQDTRELPSWEAVGLRPRFELCWRAVLVACPLICSRGPGTTRSVP